MTSQAPDMSAPLSPMNSDRDRGVVWRMPPWQWGLLILSVGLLALPFFEGLSFMVTIWGREEYSHGYMLPFVAAFMVWQRSSLIAQTPFESSLAGILLTLLGLAFYVFGELGTIYTLVQYGFLISLGGIVLSLVGRKCFRILFPAYILLFFTVPLPNFFYNSLSSYLQLLSSELGVWLARAFGITVFLEGNVIDLGNYQLQVVEACAGLRYLFPLSALGFIAAVLFRGSLIKKTVLFLSTLPITVFMNSFRIAVIAVLVDYKGVKMAEGFIHDFEGWIVFMACAALLVMEMWILAKLGRDRLPLSEAFTIAGPDALPVPSTNLIRRRAPWSFFAVFPVLLFTVAVSFLLPHRAEVQVDRPQFAFFPNDIGVWRGQRSSLEPIYLDALKLDDYLLADYADDRGQSVNLYVAYYDSQRKGASVHSPKSCLPGGGWRMLELSRHEIAGVDIGGRPLTVNRSVIQMGDEKLLVYYWFQQRGRVITSEYLVKWYMFVDALTRNRTDGALIRLTTPVSADSNIADRDELLETFTNVLSGHLKRFVPE